MHRALMLVALLALATLAGCGAKEIDAEAKSFSADTKEQEAAIQQGSEQMQKYMRPEQKEGMGQMFEQMQQKGGAPPSSAPSN